MVEAPFAGLPGSKYDTGSLPLRATGGALAGFGCAKAVSCKPDVRTATITARNVFIISSVALGRSIASKSYCCSRIAGTPCPLVAQVEMRPRPRRNDQVSDCQ